MPAPPYDWAAMRVTFCGTGAAGFNAERVGASVFLQTETAGFLLDCGPGWLERYLRARLAPDVLRALLLSHLHFDHALGLGELLTRWAFEELPLPQVLGPRDSGDYLRRSIEFARLQHEYLSGRQLDRLDSLEAIQTRPGDERELHGVEITSVEVPHAPYLECLARRLAGERHTVVYSGDTAPAPEVLVPLAEGADLLIHEAYSQEALRAHGEGMSEAARAGLEQAYGVWSSPICSRKNSRRS